MSVQADNSFSTQTQFGKTNNFQWLDHDYCCFYVGYWPMRFLTFRVVLFGKYEETQEIVSTLSSRDVEV